MKKAKIVIDVDDSFECGCCSECYFSYVYEYDDNGLIEYDDLCVLGCHYSDCPIELVEEL